MRSVTIQVSKPIVSRHVGLALTGMVSLFAFWKPLNALFRFSLAHEYASHILLIPLVSLYLIYLERRKIFQEVRSSYRIGVTLIFTGVLLYWLALRQSPVLSENNSLSAAIFSIVVAWMGGFLLCYGMRAFRSAVFPLFFLFLMVPIPSSVLAQAIFLLQRGSTEISELLFKLLGVPVFRNGFLLSLPGVTIEVAKECSGIRSSVALFITCLLASYLFLRSGWKRTIFVLLAFPLAVIKNGIRILTLSLLGIWVNPGFLHGSLHRDGGILFFLLALAILAPVLFLLQESEKKRSKMRLSERRGYAL